MATTFSWSKLADFFRIGSREGDSEEYQSILDPTSPAFLNDETINSHNLSVGGLSKPILHGQVAGAGSRASSLVVNFDKHTQKSGSIGNNSDNINDDGKSTISSSTFGDDVSSDVYDDGEYDSIDNLDSKSPPLLGMILVTISAVCYAALNLSVKALMDETPWQELMIIRMGITWMATMVWILIKYKGQMTLWGPRDKRLLLTWRAFFLWGAMFCCWWSFEFLPVGDGTTLAQSFPFCTAIIAHFVFRDENTGISQRSSSRLDKWGWLCVLSGLTGVIFVAQPSFIFGGDVYGPARDVGVILGLCSAVCAGAQYVIVNYTKEECHWLQVEQITAFLSTFILMPIGFAAFAAVRYYNTGVFTIGWEKLNGIRWMEEIALGLLGFCALALLTRGSQLDAPARTAICSYLQIPVTYAGQCIMTKTLPNFYVIIGIVLVLTSVIVPAVRKLRAAEREKLEKEKLREEEKIRRKLAKEANKKMHGHNSDIDSDIASTESDGMNRNERSALLTKYRSQGIVNDLEDVPKYTINVSNSSFGSIGGRSARRARLIKSHSQRGRYNDYPSSSSDESL